ncbi:MAG: DctP family TRAP transporter solute-binding subunit [Candidatus Eremiobacteraeota bacterium]|nr:DctP family TRAP transporter solute-binding subunit [Candidatus Eremiobacteraeota bacterium]MBV8434589.1 DctP family TRAP transporter solute-binding subunit [Candidatus Eremiobacteraeota bacterium]
MIAERHEGEFDKFNASISAAVEAVRQTSETIAATAQEQTTLMVALSESAGILAKQSHETAERLAAAQSQARAAAEDLGNSFEVVETLLTSVQQLAELSAATAAAMDDFGRLMSEVGRMTDFVEEVSDETQLLALNAAIEAARAGQHGLGFAVVAGEVGRLAKTTSESTSTIKHLVGDVQREAEATIAAVRANAQRSAESAPLADAAHSSLGEIAELAADLSVAIDRAVVAGREHSTLAAQMRHDTDGLASAAAHQGRQALESAFATQRLSYYGAEIAYISRARSVAKSERTSLRVATLLPPGYPPSRAWEHVKERAAELSGGRLQLELEIPFGGGSEFEALLRVRSGELDMVSVTTFVAGALLPLAQLFDLPFVFSDLREAHAVLDGPLGKHVLASFGSFGVTGMAYFENGMRHFTNSLRPIARPHDMKRMRVRIQDSVVYLALMHALGASPKVIPFPQLRRALADHEVDAQENPLPNILGARLHEVQSYLTLTAHAYNTQVVLANVERMHALTDDDRDVLHVAFSEATDVHRRLAAEEELHAIAELRKRLQIHELEPTEREAFVSAARFVWERMEPLFPTDVYRLLVARNLGAWHPKTAIADRGHQSFTLDDIVTSIDDSVRSVRSTGDGISVLARSQIAGLEALAQHAARLSASNRTLAGEFSQLRDRFAAVAPQVETMRGTVDHLISTIETLSSMALQSRKALDQFANSMKQIVEIIALVRSVSDKTNLLALNAAIEAARAGDFGKGFNVVAGEVRNLAEKTKASTKEIRMVLTDLEQRGKEAAVAIGSGVSKAEHSSRQARAAQEAFGRIETFAFSASRTLGDAHEAAEAESQRSHAMSGDYSQMATLVDNYANDSTRALGVTVELEHQRKALFA